MGFLDETKKHGLYADIFDFDLINPDVKLMEEILRNNPFDGIFAFSDTLAFTAISILKRMGKKVPEDVSLIGFDDIPFANWVIPSLTTIHQSVRLMGKQSFISLTRLIRNVELDTLHDIIDVELVERETTK